MMVHAMQNGIPVAMDKFNHFNNIVNKQHHRMYNQVVNSFKNEHEINRNYKLIERDASYEVEFPTRTSYVSIIDIVEDSQSTSN